MSCDYEKILYIGKIRLIFVELMVRNYSNQIGYFQLLAVCVFLTDRIVFKY